ncbi:MAG: 4Fe-4S dicluster domain-containing protein [Smithellaceae bacterium]|nr:4Fe-4S dicluster domain-containing protein [Smithellaceae bacterium]
MSEKMKVIDVSKCTGCRGCQLACKQWNQLPAKQTKNVGTYQNPPELQPNTWTLVRFQEIKKDDGSVKWTFRKEGCMHCTDAACVKVCPSGALHHTEFGTVGIAQEKCIGCKECMSACPFEVPRYDSEKNKVSKCDLCFSRVAENLPPACVKACPTGALSFGDKADMLPKAQKRVAQLGGDASLYGDGFVGGTHVAYVLQEKPEVYVKLPRNPQVPLSVIIWKDLLKPVALLGAGAVVGGALLHYLIHGPKRPVEITEDGKKEGGN